MLVTPTSKMSSQTREKRFNITKDYIPEKHHANRTQKSHLKQCTS
jgi:hypothetical protein